MAQLLSFASLGVPTGLALSLRGGAAPEPIDPEVRTLGPISGPEAPIEVEFVGISEDQQRRALDGFPGGKRFVLAADSQH